MTKSIDPEPKKRHIVLIKGLVVSLLLLMLFMLLQSLELKFLKLHYKWIIVSCIPFVLALLLGGYIKVFKGFGIELEANLSKPIPLTLVSQLEITPMPKMDKSTTGDLDSLTEREKNTIKVLSFIYRRTNYYNGRAVAEYIKRLPNLEYIQLVNKKNEFLYLIPIDLLRNSISLHDVDTISSFVRVIETGLVHTKLFEVVSEYISKNISLIDAYKKIKYNLQNKIKHLHDEGLPVLDNSHNLIGILWLSIIEKRISEDVVKSI